MAQVNFDSELSKQRMMEIQRLLRTEIMSIEQIAKAMELTPQIVQPFAKYMRDQGLVVIDRQEPVGWGKDKNFYRWSGGEIDLLDYQPTETAEKKSGKSARDPLVSALFGAA